MGEGCFRAFILLLPTVLFHLLEKVFANLPSLMVHMNLPPLLQEMFGRFLIFFQFLVFFIFYDYQKSYNNASKYN